MAMRQESDAIEIYTDEPIVSCGDKTVILPHLSHRLILNLAKVAPTPLDGATLRKLVWADVHVSDDAVKQRVKLLRAALESAGIERARVDTVPGIGYRLKGPVKIRNGAPVSANINKESAWLSLQTLPGKLIASVVTVAFAAVLVFQFFLSGRNQETGIASDSDIRIAVMTLAAENDNEAAAFSVSVGLREQLIGILSRHSGLASVASSSIDAVKSERISEMGALLDVEAVIEGSVRSDNTEKRLSIRLIDATTEALIWSGEFGQPVSASLGDWSQIAFYVSKQMFLELEGRMPMTRRGGTSDSAAYRYYLEGIHFLKKPTETADYEQAIQLFEQALDRDSDFLLARSRRAESIAYLTLLETASTDRLDELLAETNAILEQDKGLAEGNFAHGLALYVSGERELADTFFRKAEKRRPYLRWDINRLN